MVKDSKIQFIQSLIEEAIDKKTGVMEIAIEHELNPKYIQTFIAEVKAKRKPCYTFPDNETKELLSIYTKYLETSRKSVEQQKKQVTPRHKKEENYDAFLDENYDSRSYSQLLRESDEEVTLADDHIVKKISSYYYNIKVQGEPDLVGYLTREEMNLIYRLYSNMDGAGLNQRTISRELKHLSFKDFKRILRAFNITKSSIPVAPHVIEEGSEEEVVDIIFRAKENNILRRLEHDRGKHVELALKETQKELVELKDNIKLSNELFSGLIINDIEPFYIEQKQVNDECALIVYLSDMHVGADTSDDSIYSNPYNEEEFNDRLKKVIDHILEVQRTYSRFDKIIICNLGDSLDGFNAETTRKGHHLPQNLNNKEQFNVYTKGMIRFFDTLYTLNLANAIEYQCIGDDNHSGDFGYMANKLLSTYLNLKYPKMVVNLFEKFIQHFTYGTHSFILTHGKDKIDMKFGYALNLNDKIENKINEYLDYNEIFTPSTHFISGDLHQTSVNYAKRFRYKKVASMYGSSKWIHNNFGNTKAAVDYDIVFKNRKTILEGRVNLN